tara:strand:+ start:1647 stop:1934 length:288 start_codon:yes stop_codon:yes gene_type:complete
MGRYFDRQMKRFGLLGKSQSEPDQEMETQKIEVPEFSEEEKELARAQKEQLDRMSQYSNLFARIGEGNNPPPSNKKMVEPDDEVLLSGLMNMLDY